MSKGGRNQRKLVIAIGLEVASGSKQTFMKVWNHKVAQLVEVNINLCVTSGSSKHRFQ